MMLGIHTKAQVPDIENDVFDYVSPKLGPDDRALLIVTWTLGRMMYSGRWVVWL